MKGEFLKASSSHIWCRHTPTVFFSDSAQHKLHYEPGESMERGKEKTKEEERGSLVEKGKSKREMKLAATSRI